MRFVRSVLVLSLLTAGSLAACNSVTGVNDLTFDRPTTSSSTGGATNNGAGGAFGFGGAAAVGPGGPGQGAGGMCMLTGIAEGACSMCLRASCCEQTRACLGDGQCAQCAVADICPDGSQADAATTNLFGCIELHCATPCSAQTMMAGGGGAPTTTVGGSTQGGPQGVGAGGTSSSTQGGGGACDTLPHAQCESCCANENMDGALQFQSVGESCACQAVLDGCDGPTLCGNPTTCTTKWIEPGCEACSPFFTCVENACPSGTPCGSFLECGTNCNP